MMIINTAKIHGEKKSGMCKKVSLVDSHKQMKIEKK